ncbi:Hsp20/alpha crystallin family protein [[Lactobacillus] timonensis]|jgi:HSP20 family protein|uniref:Hsp20/alpha crystallin family protein n=1 Tax=[Lactobacillus] timonensis TaxID=1970790 RepID=UPI000C85F58A|nr:Hsp20/alpha crystallin family protein [[Lactobacillus] timonensis]
MANDIERRKNFFDDMMNVRNWTNPSFFDETPDYMKTDIAETEKEYRVKVDMPGFNKKDIHISYNNNVLTITGHRDTFADESDKEGNVLHSERSYGQLSRQYRLPDVDIDKVNAKYTDGVLILTLPKLTLNGDGGNRIEID